MFVDVVPNQLECVEAADDFQGPKCYLNPNLTRMNCQTSWRLLDELGGLCNVDFEDEDLDSVSFPSVSPTSSGTCSGTPASGVSGYM